MATMAWGRPIEEPHNGHNGMGMTGMTVIEELHNGRNGMGTIGMPPGRRLFNMARRPSREA